MRTLVNAFYEDEKTGESFGFSSGRTCDTLAERVNTAILRDVSSNSLDTIIKVEFTKMCKELTDIVNAQSGMHIPAQSTSRIKFASQQQSQAQSNANKSEKSESIALPKIAKDLGLDNVECRELLTSLISDKLTEEQKRETEKELKKKMKNEEDKRKLEELLKAEELKKWQEAEKKRLELERKERERLEQEQLQKMAEEKRKKLLGKKRFRST
jgi:hypothetical protein